MSRRRSATDCAHISRRAFALLVASGIGFRQRRAAADSGSAFRVVVHPKNPIASASRDFLERAFLRNVHDWGDGHAIKPVDLLPPSRVRRAFSERVLKRSVEAVKSYWQQRIFSGRGIPPPEMRSGADVITYVLQHRGAVGYVGPDEELRGARLVDVR